MGGIDGGKRMQKRIAKSMHAIEACDNLSRRGVYEMNEKQLWFDAFIFANSLLGKSWNSLPNSAMTCLRNILLVVAHVRWICTEREINEKILMWI